MTGSYATKLDGIAAGATANTGTVTSVNGTGTVRGLTLTGSVTASGSLTLGGSLTIPTLDEVLTAGASTTQTATVGRINFTNTTVYIGKVGVNDWIDLANTAYVVAGGGITPRLDNAYVLGTGSFRWNTVFAATGTINTSDARQKTDITTETLGLNFVNKLKPVSYKWISRNGETNEPGIRTFHGLIAQDVKQTLDELDVESFAGWILTDKDDPESDQGLRYTEFIAPLIKAVQELSEQNKQLLARIDRLENTV